MTAHFIVNLLYAILDLACFIIAYPIISSKVEEKFGKKIKLGFEVLVVVVLISRIFGV